MSGDPRIGTELAGYRVERLLGRGGMSVVYLGEDPRLRRRVALKLLAPELAEDERFRERFLRESRLAASLDHPNVIPIYEAGETGGVLFIAMRYVEGTDLKQLLEQERRLEPARALAILGQVGEALDVAHQQGLIHRDVKPGNVLIASQAGREHVYLSDFGLTKQAGSESRLTETGQFIGTAYYVSPEQVARQPATAASDLYALACVLFECLAGEPPYRSESLMGILYGHAGAPIPSLHEQRPELPQEIDPVIERALAKDPGQRHPTCRQLIEQARSALAISGEPEPASAFTRKRLLLAAGAVIGVAAAAAVPAALLTRRNSNEATPLVIEPGSVVQIDPATNQPVAAVGLQGWSGAGTIAVGAGAVWAANALDGTVSRIDPQSAAVTRTVSVRGSPAPFGICAGEGAIWILSAFEGDSRLSEIDPTTGRVRRAHTLGLAGPVGVASGDGAVWATANHVEGSSVLRIESATGEIITGIPFREPLGTIAAGADSVWAVSAPPTLGSTAGKVWRIDWATNEAVEAAEIRDLVTVASGEGAVWLGQGYVGEVAAVRLDPDTGAPLATVAVGGLGAPHAPILAVGGGAVWVVSLTQGTVSRIDPATNRVAAKIDMLGKQSTGLPTGSGPFAIAANDEEVWVGIFG